MEKLAFFGPDNKKYGFTVMSFGPVNVPYFYSYTMGAFKTEWYLLFIEELCDIAIFKGILGTHKLSLIDDNVYMDNIKLTPGTKSIIDDILIWSNNVQEILLYFECVCKIFQKYRVSFHLNKCRFLQSRVEFVGRDLTSDGDCPAQSKFDLIRDWEVLKSGQSLHSFVDLLLFYSKHKPYLEMNIKR